MLSTGPANGSGVVKRSGPYMWWRGCRYTANRCSQTTQLGESDRTGNRDKSTDAAPIAADTFRGMGFLALAPLRWGCCPCLPVCIPVPHPGPILSADRPPQGQYARLRCGVWPGCCPYTQTPDARPLFGAPCGVESDCPPGRPAPVRGPLRGADPC